MAEPTGRGAYRFGPFQLDVRERRLSRGPEVIPLRLKVFDTLRVLVESAGKLLTKQELLDAVWPETTVEENNLNHNVSVLRKALGERATGQQYIETVPRVGYRFIAGVETTEPRDGSSRGVRGEAATGNPVLHVERRRSPRVRDHRQRPAARESVELAHPSRFRVGQPDLASLVVRALAAPSHRPLRRARQRDVSAGRRGRQLRHVGTGSRDGGRRGGTRPVSAARHFPRRSDRDCLRREASRARHAPGALRRLRGGRSHVGTPAEIEARRALASLVRLGWGLNNPAFCRTFTCRFIPEATPEQERWFDELQRVSTSPENAALLMERGDNIDVRPLLSKVQTPTLVMHCDRDGAVPAESGRHIAAAIPNARYVSLPDETI